MFILQLSAPQALRYTLCAKLFFTTLINLTYMCSGSTVYNIITDKKKTFSKNKKNDLFFALSFKLYL